MFSLFVQFLQNGEVCVHQVGHSGVVVICAVQNMIQVFDLDTLDVLQQRLDFFCVLLHSGFQLRAVQAFFDAIFLISFLE